MTSFNPKRMFEQKKTALYCRLSQEDEKAGDSMSIKNQKMFLKEFAERNGLANIRFFVDDGFSGVDFEKRESFQEMLREVEAGRVGTVITKDLSRLGRNYLRTGELIEIIFPENGVRYIAINDNVDTEREDNEFTPLKNWFNEFYARDTSKKIRAVKRAQAQRGERVNNDAPYGYMVSPDIKHQLLPDPETAPVVKQIFTMYIQGTRVCHIQDWLRDNKIVTPAELEYQRRGKSRHKRPPLEEIHNWSGKTIEDILVRKEYLGHTFTNKSSRLSYKSNKIICHPKSEWYSFLNTHEPLVDDEVFELAQKRMSTRQRHDISGELDLFSGLLYCSDCGKKLTCRRGSKTPEAQHSYVCAGYRNRARHKSNCSSHYIRKTVLMELVLADIQRISAYVKENESEFFRKAVAYGNREANAVLAAKTKELTKAEERMETLDRVFVKAYEDREAGRLSEQQYNALTNNYDKESESLRGTIEKLQREVSGAKKLDGDAKRFLKVVKKHTNIQELTYENLHELIDKIVIQKLDKETNTRTIEIHYSFVGKIACCGETISATKMRRYTTTAS